MQNIHRIADLVRGQVILPNSRLSINTLVGRRTTARGFVNAPVIEDGKFAEDIGGGVSQFATTLFNAAFLAGLNIPSYQSHSIYISRYPYGREATLNYPQPDLIIENKTPYGVLVWPTYTSTTIAVTLYSTKYSPGVQVGQGQSKSGVCTLVRSDARADVPGRQEVDGQLHGALSPPGGDQLRRVGHARDVDDPADGDDEAAERYDDYGRAATNDSRAAAADNGRALTSCGSR